MKLLRFLIRFACLTLSIRVAAAESAGIGRKLSGSIRLDSDGVAASLGLRESKGRLFETGLSWSFAGRVPEGGYLIVEAEDHAVRAGEGRPQEGRSLRRSPYLPPVPGAAFTGAPTVRTRAAGRIVFLSVEESRWFISWGEGESLADLPREAGFELAKVSGNFSAGMGAGIAFSRAVAPGEGWKPRALRTPAMHSALLASCMRLSLPQARVDFWAAGSSGEAASPGLAIALNLESLSDSGVGIAVFGYAAGPGYRGPGGSEPARDAAVELAASAGTGTLEAKLRFGLHSLKGYPDWLGYRGLRSLDAGRPLISDPAAFFDHALLLWEPDVLSSSLSAGFQSGRLAFDLAADRAGLSRAGFLARFDGDALLRALLPPEKSLRLSIGTKMNFIAAGRPEDDLEEEWTDEEPDGDFSDASSEEAGAPPSSAGGRLPPVFRGSLALSSLKADVQLAWGGGRGSLAVGLSARNLSSEPEFQISGRLSLRLFSSSRAEAGLRISTPPGGYSFDAFPGEWPSVAVDWRISARPSRNRLTGI